MGLMRCKKVIKLHIDNNNLMFCDQRVSIWMCYDLECAEGATAVAVAAILCVVHWCLTSASSISNLP